MTCQLCRLHEPREDTITWPHPVCDRCWHELGEPGQPPSDRFMRAVQTETAALEQVGRMVLDYARSMVINGDASHPRDALRALRQRYPEHIIQAAWKLLCEREPNNERFEL